MNVLDEVNRIAAAASARPARETEACALDALAHVCDLLAGVLAKRRQACHDLAAKLRSDEVVTDDDYRPLVTTITDYALLVRLVDQASVTASLAVVRRIVDDKARR